MIYPQRDIQRTKKRRRIFWSLCSLCLIIVLCLSVFTPHLFSPLVDFVAVPILNSKITVLGGTNTMWEVLQSKLSLIHKNNDLENQLKLLTAVQAERDALSKENDSLRSLLGRATSTNPGVVAHVLSKPNFSPYDTLIVDAGSSNGILVGDIVLVDESIIIGEVSSISPHTANIKMYSTADEKTPIFIGSKSLESTANGLGGGNFDVRLPKNAGVAVGDQVVLSKYPEYIFGSIARIDDTPIDSFDRVLFTSPVNINEISFVTIHHSSHESPSNH